MRPNFKLFTQKSHVGFEVKMMPKENIQQFRSVGAWNVSFCIKIKTERSFSMMQDFGQSSEAVGFSQVSKMLRQLTGQISAH